MTHDNVHIIGQRPTVPSEEGVALTPPDRHVLWLVERARFASENGDWDEFVTEICHAVLVGTFKGPQGITQHDLICALRKIAGFGFPTIDPGEAA